MAITEANHDVEVKLDIRTKDFGGAGWTRVMADNDVAYGYKYAGGNHPDHHGHVKHTIGKGAALVTVVLKDPKHFLISKIFFIGDDANQLHNPHGGVIKNLCTAAMDAAYKVRVVDLTTKAIFLCDPVIRNVPHPN